MPRGRMLTGLKRGLPASDLAVALLTQKNSSGNGATASVSPTAGGLLFATVTTSETATWTPGGTLTGSWTQRASFNSANGRSHAIYTCPDYGASGTVAFTPSAGSWTQVGVYHASSATGQLVVDGTIQQSKVADVVSPGPSAAWTTPPAVYGGFVYVNSIGPYDPGSGWTQLVESSAFDALASQWSQAPNATIAYTVEQTTTYLAIEFKRA